MKKFSILLMFFLCATCIGFAQNVSSALRATVLDSSGAAVPGAECTLTNQATSAALSVKTDGQGSCTFNIIPAGTYTFGAQAKGFKALATRDIAVEAGATQGWHRYVGDTGDVIGVDRFGASAPGATVLREYGFTVDEVYARAKMLLS